MFCFCFVYICSYERKYRRQEESCTSPTYEDIGQSNYDKRRSNAGPEIHLESHPKAYTGTENLRISGSTKEERAQCQTSREVCAVCRNSYTGFRSEYAAAYEGLEECSKQDPMIKNIVYDGAGDDC